MQQRLKVVIIGAGIGGLACAIACRQQGLDVIVLERSTEILPVGAGIQLPPNATRVMRHLGLEAALQSAGAVTLEGHNLRSYDSGDPVRRRPLGQAALDLYGSAWMVIHRADYQRMLLDAAVQHGAQLCTGCEITKVKSFADCSVQLKDGRVVEADVIVGADGLWSVMRNEVLGRVSTPNETGDLAYRGTFRAEQLRDCRDDRVQEVLNAADLQVWMGPGKHVVFYPVRNKEEFNLVLIKPDDLPEGTRTELGSLEEMRRAFEGWDSALTTMISQLQSALKWKLCHHQELETWRKDRVVLLGDSCHPTLPYQAQGAAMAVEDGAVLGRLLGRLQNYEMHDGSRLNMKDLAPELLVLFEKLRKSRTAVNVKGATQMRTFYHLPDGPLQEERDNLLQDLDLLSSACKWNWGDAEYQRALMGFDSVADAAEQFDRWIECHV